MNVLMEIVLIPFEAAYTKICLNPVVIRWSYCMADLRVLIILFFNYFFWKSLGFFSKKSYLWNLYMVVAAM